MKKLKTWLFTNLPLFLAVVLYILIYYIRFQQALPAGRQGGWEFKLDLFPQIRKDLDSKIALFLPSPQAQLLSGIVLGQKKDLPYDLSLALRDTSTLHIVVVSGQNLSMVAGFFLLLSGLIRRKIAILLSFSTIIFYTLLTGADVPVLRAAVMISLTFLAQIIGRQQDSLWVLIITAASMLLVNPNWLGTLSFQLSFMATLGLVAVTPTLLRLFKRVPFLGADLAVTFGAQIMVMPIIIQNFHQLSFVSVITNIFIGWTVPLIMILGAVLLFLSFISEFLSQIVAFILEILLTYFIYIVQFFASLPFAWEFVGEQVWVVWVGYYLVVVGLLFGLHKYEIQSISPDPKTML